MKGIELEVPLLLTDIEKGKWMKENGITEQALRTHEEVLDWLDCPEDVDTAAIIGSVIHFKDGKPWKWNDELRFNEKEERLAPKPNLIIGMYRKIVSSFK